MVVDNRKVSSPAVSSQAPAFVAQPIQNMDLGLRENSHDLAIKKSST